MIHVYPENDTRVHVLIGDTCGCKPRIEYVTADDEPICIHNAWDLREALEEVISLPEKKGVYP